MTKFKLLSRFVWAHFVLILCVAGLGSSQQRRISLAEIIGIQLEPAAVTETPLPPIGGIIGQIRCNSAGDLYLKTEFSPLIRLSANGQSVTYFDLNSIPKVDLASRSEPLILDFAVDSSNSVFVLGTEARRPFIFVFGRDGRYRSKTGIDALESFKPSRIAVFSGGNFLMTGDIFLDEKGRSRKPVAQVFSSTGQEIATLSLISAKPQSNTKTVTESPLSFPMSSVVVSEDGNAYIMRNLDPPLVYVVSPAGRLIRKLGIQSPKGFGATGIMVGDTKFLVTYQHGDGRNYRMLYVEYDNIDAYVVAKYENGPRINGALTCYSDSELTFLGVREGRRVLIRARPH